MKYKTKDMTQEEWNETTTGVHVRLTYNPYALNNLVIWIYEGGSDTTDKWENEGIYKRVLSNYMLRQTAQGNILPLVAWMRVNGLPRPDSVSIPWGDEGIAFKIEWEEE